MNTNPMSFSRRDFMKSSGIAALAGIGLAGSAFASLPNERSLDQTCERFRQHLGAQFLLTNDSNEFTATLTDIQEFPGAWKDGECFSLEFRVGANQAGPATYDVYNPNFGKFQLFMTEESFENTRGLFAIINRI